MKTTVVTLTFLVAFLTISTAFTPAPIPESKGKQKKYFPKIIKEGKVYFGMTEEKFLKKHGQAQQENSTDFRKSYREKFSSGEIEEITYYFTNSPTPQLYEFIIKYKDMNTVLPTAKELLGEPNHQGEWRINKSLIKEDFMMAVWTFGHKIVYATSLKGSEWESGF